MFSRLLILARVLEKYGKFRLDIIEDFAKRCHCELEYRGKITNAVDFQKRTMIKKPSRELPSIIDQNLKYLVNSIIEEDKRNELSKN